jgi:UrcA family protein
MFDRARLRNTSILICASLMLVGAPLASASAAGSNTETLSIAVDSRDLNLTSQSGQDQLRARIAHAVDRICGSSHVRETWKVDAYANCSKMAHASADAQFETQVAAAMNAQKLAGEGASTARTMR